MRVERVEDSKWGVGEKIEKTKDEKEKDRVKGGGNIKREVKEEGEGSKTRPSIGAAAPIRWGLARRVGGRGPGWELGLGGGAALEKRGHLDVRVTREAL